MGYPAGDTEAVRIVRIIAIAISVPVSLIASTVPISYIASDSPNHQIGLFDKAEDSIGRSMERTNSDIAKIATKAMIELQEIKAEVATKSPEVLKSQSPPEFDPAEKELLHLIKTGWSKDQVRYAMDSLIELQEIKAEAAKHSLSPSHDPPPSEVDKTERMLAYIVMNGTPGESERAFDQLVEILKSKEGKQ